MKSIFIAAAFFTLTIISCKKKADEPPKPVYDQSYTASGQTHPVRFDSWSIDDSLHTAYVLFQGESRRHISFTFPAKPTKSGQYKVVPSSALITGAWADDNVIVSGEAEGSLGCYQSADARIDVVVSGNSLSINADTIVLYDSGFLGLAAGPTYCSFHLVDH